MTSLLIKMIIYFGTIFNKIFWKNCKIFSLLGLPLKVGESIWSEICWKYVNIFLRNSWENLGKIFRNWFWRTFLWKFPRISTTLVNIFSVYSPELVTKNSLELITRNFLDRVMRSSPEWGREIPRNGLREIPLNFCQHFHRIFL